MGPTISAVILQRYWQQVDFAVTWRLVVATLLGIPVGVLGLRLLPSLWIIHSIGVMLMVYGLYRLSGVSLPKLTSPHWALPFGWVAGILGGAYNTNGPPVVVYGNMRRWLPEQFRASLQGYFFPTGLGILVSHGLGGLWTAQIFRLYALSLPGVLTAIVLGSWCNHRLSIEQFQHWLSLLLILLGVMLWL